MSTTQVDVAEGEKPEDASQDMSENDAIGREYLRPLQLHGSHRSPNGKDDDSARYFMSEPSLSEEGETSERDQRQEMSGLALLDMQQESYHTEEEDDDEDSRFRGPSPSAPYSPGTTSLSSWDSPHVSHKVHVQFIPESRRWRSIGLSRGPALPAASRKKDTAAPVADENKAPTTGKSLESQRSSRSNSSTSIGEQQRVTDFLEELKNQSKGQLANADSDYYDHHDMMLPDPDRKSQIGKVVRERVPMRSSMRPPTPPTSRRRSTQSSRSRAPEIDTDQDETLVMTLSASEGEAEDGDDDEEPLDWEQQHSADDEQTTERRAKLRARRSASKPQHRRSKSGDDVAAQLGTGRKEWVGMQEDMLPLPEAHDDEESDHDVEPVERESKLSPIRASNSCESRRRSNKPGLRNQTNQTANGNLTGTKGISDNRSSENKFSVGSSDPSARHARRTRRPPRLRRPSHLDRHSFWHNSMPHLGDGTYSPTTVPRSAMIPTFVHQDSAASSLDGSMSTLDLFGPESPRPSKPRGSANDSIVSSDVSYGPDIPVEFNQRQQQRRATELTGSFRSIMPPDAQRRYSDGSSLCSSSPMLWYQRPASGSQESLDSEFSWLSGPQRTASLKSSNSSHRRNSSLVPNTHAQLDKEKQPKSRPAQGFMAMGSSHQRSDSLRSFQLEEEQDDDDDDNDPSEEDPVSIRRNILRMREGHLESDENLFEGRSFRGPAQGMMRPHFPHLSPFANFGRKTISSIPKIAEFKPVTNVVETDDKGYATFVCPNCGTKQREFFTVASAPTQFESPAGYLAFYFGLYVVASLYIFGLQEGWPALDCIYFAVITLTTAGLGDFVPTSDSAKIICSIFIYFGVACIGLLLGTYIASMLDDKSYQAAQKSRVNNCVRCGKGKAVSRQRGRRQEPSPAPSVSPRDYQTSFQKYGSMYHDLGASDPSLGFEFRHTATPFSDAEAESSNKRQKHERSAPAAPVMNGFPQAPVLNHVGGSSTTSYTVSDTSSREQHFETVMEDQETPPSSFNRSAAVWPSNFSSVPARINAPKTTAPTRPPIQRQAPQGINAGVDRMSEVPKTNKGRPGGSLDVIDSYALAQGRSVPPPPPPPPSTPPVTPKQIITPSSPHQGVLGSPMTRNILGRQSHTRHSSLDPSSAVFRSVSSSSTRPPTIRHRNFTEDVRPSSGTDSGSRRGTPTMSFQSTRYGESSEDYDSQADESGDEFSMASDVQLDESFQPMSKVQTAKYIFVTLQKALMNSTMIIAIGSVGFYFIEKMTVVDSFYFTTVLLTTVGYGDIAPVTSTGKLFATIYVLLAGTVLLHNMSMISMIPLELRKKRVERAVLTQFGDQLDDAALRELATGPLVKRLQLSFKQVNGLEECTREMFALAMLVRLGKVTEKDVRQTFAAFRKLDVDNDGVLNSKTIIAGMHMAKRRSRLNLAALGESGPSRGQRRQQHWMGGSVASSTGFGGVFSFDTPRSSPTEPTTEASSLLNNTPRGYNAYSGQGWFHPLSSSGGGIMV